MSQRRRFLKTSAFASASLLAPDFIAQSLPKGSPGKKIFIVIQLSGGNDGLNTIIPHQNDTYYRLRPKLSIAPGLVLPVTSDLGFHPALAPLRTSFDQGEMLVINGVGYPNPNRSHFRSMDIWQTGSDADSYFSTGWLGRYLDHECDGCSKAYHALQIGDNLGMALQGEHRDGFAMRDGHHLRRLNSNAFLQKLGRQERHPSDRTEQELSYLYKTMVEVQESADYLIQQSKIIQSKSSFPAHPFGRGMKLISELITAQTSSKVYYISLPGFDTHANQLARQDKLLRVYAQAVAALVKDLKRHRLFNDCLIMTFSEFGRRVEENGSLGTDHGTANSVLLMGGSLGRAGSYNDIPSLTALDQGDLQHSLDFRRIYATVLEKWLDMPAATVLPGVFQTLDFLG